MSKILCFDTALAKLYVSIFENNSLISSKIVSSNDTHYHTAYLIKIIADMLKDNNLKMTDINLLGVNRGPGSFTGIRAGLTIANVISKQLNIKVISSNSLEIISSIGNKDKKILVALDARRNKAYIGIYHNMKEILPPSLYDIENITPLVDENTIIISDNNLKVYFPEALSYEENYDILNDSLAFITYHKYIHKIPSNDMEPLYLTQPYISQTKKKC